MMPETKSLWEKTRSTEKHIRTKPAALYIPYILCHVPLNFKAIPQTGFLQILPSRQ